MDGPDDRGGRRKMDGPDDRGGRRKMGEPDDQDGRWNQWILDAVRDRIWWAAQNRRKIFSDL
jgi:hypothetical protein